MFCGAVLLLAASSLCSSSPVDNDDKAAPKELKYLLDPPVFAEVRGRTGQNATLPCILKTRPTHYRVKWTKLEPERVGTENIVMISNERSSRPYGRLGPRASLRRAHAMDASLLLHRLQLLDGGRYRCELINGIEDESVVITLSVEGVVFPYQSESGRYQLTFGEAEEACAAQDGVLASSAQLYRAWTEGLDWCNAGWLLDGSVRYPILYPRTPCGGALPPGIRSYGPRDKRQDRFDTFCFTSLMPGSVFFLPGPFTFPQAGRACSEAAAQLSSVGQLFSAWRFHGLDRCDGGWLKDGSVRFPIVAPREPCGGVAEPGVRSFGFPDKKDAAFGAYCYR